MTLPTHIAIIMDGNGRWAKARGLPRTLGHKRGAEALRATIEACRTLGVPYLTVYAFSSENWKRPEEEVSSLMELLKHNLKKELGTMEQNGIRLRFIGNRARLAPDIQAMVTDAEAKTAQFDAFHFTIALSYGAREELARAATKALSSGLPITAEAIEQHLDTAGLPDPDLVIRTGGEQRLSNFLLWQSAYAELYFTDTLWPDFGKEHLDAAIHCFNQRERRYGNTTA